MRALSFLFAALLGIALAMIAPALAGPASSAPGTAVEAVTTATVAEMEIPARLSDAALSPDQGDELEAGLRADLGLDAFQPGDAA